MSTTRRIFIKQSMPDSGRDTKTFRAYFDIGSEPMREESMRVSGSCTGNVEHGALNCAAKAFIKYYEPEAAFTEIKNRIQLKDTGRGFWIATLKSV